MAVDLILYMRTGTYIKSAFGFIFLIIFAVSCKKEKAKTPYVLSYGSSVIYLKNQAGDTKVFPLEYRAGQYTAFPEGIELDEDNGEINVSKSETGLRYRITHTALNGDTTSTVVMLSGIQFLDKYYNLSQHDSIARPVYNGNPANAIPLAGSVFDENQFANSGGCSVKTNNGEINLAQTVRNGVFGTVPQNDARRDFDIDYRLNDASGKALNKIRVRLYWYDTMNDVPADILQLLNDRQTQGVFLQANNDQNPFMQFTARNATASAAARPRPPCVIIIGQ